jgi:ribosomal protein S6
MTYNLTLVLRSTLKEGDRKKLLEGIKSQFGKAKVNEKEWGQKALSYPIKKEVSGYYISMSVEPEATIPNDLERRLLNNNDVLRHLLLRSK